MANIPFKIIDGTRANSKLYAAGGYLYYLNNYSKKNRDILYLVCKEKQCPAKATATMSSMTLKLSVIDGVHSCKVTAVDVRAAELKVCFIVCHDH